MWDQAGQIMYAPCTIGFNTRTILKTFYEFNIDLHQLCIDCRRIWKCPKTYSLFKTMAEVRIPLKLIRLARMTLTNTKYKVKAWLAWVLRKNGISNCEIVIQLVTYRILTAGLRNQSDNKLNTKTSKGTLYVE